MLKLAPTLVLTAALLGSAHAAYAQRTPDAAAPNGKDGAADLERDASATPLSRYVTGDVLGALKAWNMQQEPIIESVRVYGPHRTDPAVFANVAGLTPGKLLTPDRFLRAQRRLGQLPVDSVVNYSPLPDGRARAEVNIDEPSILPSGLVPIATVVADGLITREFELAAASPTGHGERVSGTWRWQKNWTRYTIGADLPLPGTLAGLLSVTARWEQQLFEPAPEISTTRERRSLGVGFSTWATSWLWWRAGVAADRLTEGTYTSVNAAIENRLLQDRVALDLEAAHWTSTSGLPGFGRLAGSVSVRSTTRADTPIWLGVAGAAAAGDRAPYQMWIGAGTGSASYAPLRAHPLARHGILKGKTFGRRLAFGSLEYDRPFWRSPFGPVAWAAFTDAARAWQRAGDQAPTPWLVDVGGGLRLRANALSGAIALDVARGLRDGNVFASINLVHKWPRR